uniref:Uncharacterized protein n=1 Tax=Leptocylindrus danicus TaxID=163516 RepID=A0A7S2L4H5_9STRA
MKRHLSGSGSGSGSGDNNSGDNNDNDNGNECNGGDCNGGVHSFNFDATAYSLKYTRCQNIEYFNEYAAGNNYWNQYYNNNAQTSDSLISTKSFAVFRLCPAGSCSANSYGCSSNYGEYMVELSSFLNAMQEYKELKQEHYCDYCKACVKQQQYYDNSANNDDGGNNNNYFQPCADYSRCQYYENSCGDNDDNDNDKYAPSNYFNCVQEVGYDSNGQAVALYIGPVCDDTGITLGLFYDNQCSQYAGDQFSLSSFASNVATAVSAAGSGSNSNSMEEYYDNGCVRCKFSKMPFYYNNDNNNDDNNDDVLDLCNDLYTYSAKCEDHLTAQRYGYYTYGANMNFASEAQRTTACNFIGNVARGSYNERGRVYLDQKSYNMQQGYHTEPTVQVSAVQTFWLTVLIVGCVGMAGLAMRLHRSIVNANKTVEHIYSAGHIA